MKRCEKAQVLINSNDTVLFLNSLKKYINLCLKLVKYSFLTFISVGFQQFYLKLTLKSSDYALKIHNFLTAILSFWFHCCLLFQILQFTIHYTFPFTDHVLRNIDYVICSHNYLHYVLRFLFSRICLPNALDLIV